MITLEEWNTLQAFLVSKLYDKVPNTPDVWLPITDIENEDVWRDFYTGQKIENYTAPWIGSRLGVFDISRIPNLVMTKTKIYFWGIFQR